MVRPHEIIRVVGLCFILNKGGRNTTVEEEIQGLGCWYMWGEEGTTPVA